MAARRRADAQEVKATQRASGTARTLAETLPRLILVARARALIDGRLAPSIDDVMEMAEPILKHRMALTFAARADGESLQAVIGKLKTRIG